MNETPRDSSEESPSSVQLFISGRVQGVGYRAWFQSTAIKLGLRGWVRNLSDGRVEAFVEGPEQSLSSLVEKCHKGPIFASVKSVQVEELSSDPAALDFNKASSESVQILPVQILATV